MLAHYSQGSPVSSTELLRAARTVGFGPSELRSVLYDLPYPSQRPPARGRAVPALHRASWTCSSASPRAWSTSRSRSSSRSRTSTVRTHLHNIYGKLGAVDRAQAVLHATERGWL